MERSTNPKDYSTTHCDWRFVLIVRRCGHDAGVRVNGNLHDLIHPSLREDLQRYRGMMDPLVPLLEAMEAREGTLRDVYKRKGRMTLDHFTVAENDELAYNRLFYELREMGERIRKHAQRMLDVSMVKIAQAAVIETGGVDGNEEDDDSGDAIGAGDDGAAGQC